MAKGVQRLRFYGHRADGDTMLSLLTAMKNNGQDDKLVNGNERQGGSNGDEGVNNQPSAPTSCPSPFAATTQTGTATAIPTPSSSYTPTGTPGASVTVSTSASVTPTPAKSPRTSNPSPSASASPEAAPGGSNVGAIVVGVAGGVGGVILLLILLLCLVFLRRKRRMNVEYLPPTYADEDTDEQEMRNPASRYDKGRQSRAATYGEEMRAADSGGGNDSEYDSDVSL